MTQGSIKARIANAFGTNSRKVWRAIVGATWSLPFRYITFGAQLAAMATVPGVVVFVPLAAVVQALSVGVLVGWALRVLDNLINEFLVFEWIKNTFTQHNNKDGHGL